MISQPSGPRLAEWHRLLMLAMCLCLGVLGCGDGAQPPAAGSGMGSEGAESAGGGEAAAPSGQTHWTNQAPIGQGLGPVDAALLAAGTADPTKWLHYGGDYANFRHMK